jgi:hypothetical protein
MPTVLWCQLCCLGFVNEGEIHQTDLAASCFWLAAVALPQLLAAGCELLCTLAPLYPPAAADISQMATKCYSLASEALQQQIQPNITPSSPAAMLVAPK